MPPDTLATEEQALADLARRTLWDQWIARLWAPPSLRAPLLALAVVGHEAYKTRERSQEYALRFARLLWWREAVEAKLAREALDGAPLARFVARACEEPRLRSSCLALLDAASEEGDALPPLHGGAFPLARAEAEGRLAVLGRDKGATHESEALDLAVMLDAARLAAEVLDSTRPVSPALRAQARLSAALDRRKSLDFGCHARSNAKLMQIQLHAIRAARRALAGKAKKKPSRLLILVRLFAGL